MEEMSLRIRKLEEENSRLILVLSKVSNASSMNSDEAEESRKSDDTIKMSSEESAPLVAPVAMQSSALVFLLVVVNLYFTTK